MSGMPPEMEKLLVLQDREQKHARLTRELTVWPAEMKALEAKRVEIRAGAEKKRLEAQSTEVERKNLELEAATHRAKVARYKIQQFETRKNEEFSALGTEIAREEKEVHEIEDRELELMAKKAAAIEIEAAKGREAEVTAKELEQGKKKIELETRLADSTKEIEMLAAGLDEGVLGKYRRIMASKKDVAVVPVVHGTNCGGCHMKLTAGSAISAKAGNMSATCENCGRLLFWPVS
jgi:uncharacterized protein